MYTIKQIIARSVLAGEVILFAGFYFFGGQGRPAIQLLKADIAQQAIDIDLLQKGIALLKEEMHEWNVRPWYKEQVARESLQMALPGDEIFVY